MKCRCSMDRAGFVLNVRYPSTVALEHYSKFISKPWYYCVWGRGEWESFLDATGMDSKGRTTRFQRTGTHCGAISQLRPRRGRMVASAAKLFGLRLLDRLFDVRFSPYLKAIK
jgi:hypothetical protein